MLESWVLGIPLFSELFPSRSQWFDEQSYVVGLIAAGICRDGCDG